MNEKLWAPKQSNTVCPSGGSSFSSLVTCFASVCQLHFLAVACAKMDLLMNLMLYVIRFDDHPEISDTLNQKDSDVRDEAQSKQAPEIDG